MNMSLYWGPGSPNLNGSHGHWTILKADGSATTSWSPGSGTFTGSGGSGTASTTWTGTPLEREFKVRVWCDNVFYNGVYDVGEMVYEIPVTVFKVQIKSPPDGFDPPRQYVAAGGSVGYYAYIIPSSAAGLGFAWTGNNVPSKFTLAGAASQTVTVTAGSQPSSAINAEQVTVTVKAPVTNVALTQASQNFTIVRIDTLVLTDRLLTGNFVQREAGTSFVPTLFLSRDAAGVAKLEIDIYSSPANFMPDRFWWQITNVSDGALSNSWTLNKSRIATTSDWGPPGSDPERQWTVTAWFDDNGNGVFDTGEANTALTAYATVFTITLASVEFTSDHHVLMDNNSDWTNTGTLYGKPEWQSGWQTASPISQTKNTPLTLKVKVTVEPAGLHYDVIGDGPQSYMDFLSTGHTSTGSQQEWTITSGAALPNQVSTLTGSITWKIKFTDADPDVEFTAGTSGTHKIYVTYGTPTAPTGIAITEKRLSTTCQWANEKTDPDKVADGIHSKLGDVDPPYEPLEKPTLGIGWTLMDGTTYGECDEQADLMRLACLIQGVNPATLQLVRASTNAGAGKCLDFEDRLPNCSNPSHGNEKLLLDFGSWDMNAFEGCCDTAGAYYAVWPMRKATNDYTMLQGLGGTGVAQHYCWWDLTIQWWVPCDQPNSRPAIP
jgi:hypothetical protein